MMDFERWMNLLAGVLVVSLVRGTAVFFLAFVVTTLARRLSSQARHLVWLGVVASFLLAPLCWLILPALRVEGWIRLEEAAAHRVAALPLLARPEYLRFAEAAREYARLTGQSLPTCLRLLPPAMLLGWLAGMLFLIGRLLVGGQKLRRLRQEATTDSRLLRLAAGLAGKGSTFGKLEILCSQLCRVPFTFGLLRPVIVLPPEAGAWTKNRLSPALVHELAHVRRRDVLTQSLAYGLCLLFWFLPPLWLAYAALLREAETCCDQQVINRGFRGSAYAHTLLDIARASSDGYLLAATSAALGRPGGLEARIRNLMSLRPGRQPFGIPGAIKVLAVLLFCLLPLLAVTCATKPSLVRHDDPAFGTWVNPVFEGQAERSGKWILFPDGRELVYRYIADTEPYRERRTVIQEAWIEANGDRGYKMCSWDGEAEVWTVLKIRGEKPAEMVLILASPEGRGCCVYYRR